MSILGHFSLPGGRRSRTGFRRSAATLALAVFCHTGLANAARPTSARSGALVTYEPRPAQGEMACSFRFPLCVHAALRRGSTTRATGEVLATLAASERAWETATGALELPTPDTEPSTTRVLDLYLVDGAPYATRTLLDRRDPRGGFDRASAFALLGRGMVPGCALDGAVAEVIARAILFGVAPATDEGSARAESTYLASLMVPCAVPRDDAVGLFQSRPESSLADTFAAPSESIPAATRDVTPSLGEVYASGASLFYEWLDGRFGAYPGAIVRAVWALSPTSTGLLADRWNDSPNGFDVLRASFKNALETGGTVDDVLREFAVAREFLAFHPVRHDWTIDWPREPRTLAAATGVAPTGAAYVLVSCQQKPKGARLRFEARWEEHARMLWSLVRLGSDGRELGRVDVPTPERGTEAQLTLVDFDDAASVLAVGTNVGDPFSPFNPEDHVWEPHGWVVSLAAE